MTTGIGSARASYSGPRGGPYQGAIMVGGKPVWTCQHAHTLRDFSSWKDLSAFHCAEKVLRAMREGDRYLRDVEAWAKRGQTRGRDPAVFIERERWALAQATELKRTLEAYDAPPTSGPGT